MEIFDEIRSADFAGDPQKIFNTACVLGGSIAGLLAARVLADHAQQVLIIERDSIGGTGAPRAGVPHDRQSHVLLRGGQDQVERLFPGFTAEAQERGAILVERDRIFTQVGSRRMLNDGREPTLSATRPLIESLIRRRVSHLPNVSTVQGQVTGLEYRGNAVTAVLFNEDGIDQRFETDFTVDATGRASRLSDWLQQGGYDRPALTRVQARIDYATAQFSRSRRLELSAADTVLVTFPAEGPEANGLAGALVQAIEENRWLVTASSYGKGHAGGSLESFRELMNKMPEPFPEALSGQLVSDVCTYSQADSRRRDFVGARLPARLVAVGDAVASFNPFYGQGMTAAALHATCLRLFLRGKPDLSAPATEFFEMQQVIVDAAWVMSAGIDEARRDADEGREVAPETRARRAEMAQIAAATLVDPVVATAFNQVRYLLMHPAVLRDPALLERAAEAAKPRREGQAPAPAVLSRSRP